MQQVRLMFAALSFLTRLPSPGRMKFEADDLARSTPYFPLVGLGVGLIAGGLYAGAALLWPPWIAAAMATAGIIWATGGFHEDALADSLDGFGGGWDRAQVLTIMKDSRIGSYGAVGLVLAVTVKIAALAAMASGGPGTVVRALIAGHVLGRWSSLPLIWRHRYVRADDPDARSKPFASSVTGIRLAAGSALAGVVVVMALGHRAPLALVSASVVTVMAGGYFGRRLGGITGDCLGAANQLVELAVYLALAARVPSS